jgi:hypothetical protein
MAEVQEERLFDPILFYKKQVDPMELYLRAVGNIGLNTEQARIGSPLETEPFQPEDS